jgi:glycosyltransferase involved in cell wall biosynthesis
MAALAPPELSILVPVYNESGSLRQLHDEIGQACRKVGVPYVILFVDDGSTDGSSELLDRIADDDPAVTVIHFRKNFGKSPALAAGFEAVRGQIVITMDADLQDDPAMIPELVERIRAGADLVSGWKQRRHDPVGKTLPSRLFNFVVRRLSGVPLRDFNCGFKAYRIECVRALAVYGGFHRFIPVLANDRGFRVEELVVQHRARVHGVSKYGARRFVDGLLDLSTVLLITRYRTRPLHFFGIPALLLGMIGFGLLTYLSVLWFMGEPIGTRPLLTLGVMLVVMAGQIFCTGLVAEMVVRTATPSAEIFSVRSVYRRKGHELEARQQAEARES